MQPILFSFRLSLLGEITFPAYFTLLTIGFGVAMLLTVREGRRLGMDPDRVLDTSLWMVVWGLIGARVLHLLADGHFQDYVHLCTNPKLVPAVDAKVSWCSNAAMCGYDYLCDTVSHKCYPPRDCFAAFEIWRGGLAYYGGFFFAAAFAYYYVRKHGLGWWRTADLAAPAIALGLVFGRLGCFLNGCCYGKRTHLPFGVVFPRGGSAWRAQLDAHLITASQVALPVHPTQVYESLLCLATFLLLYFVVRPHRRFYGEVFAWLLLCYAVGRSVIEVWRDDDRGVLFGWLSTSQILSLPLFVCGIALIVLGGRRLPRAELPSPRQSAP